MFLPPIRFFNKKTVVIVAVNKKLYMLGLASLSKTFCKLFLTTLFKLEYHNRAIIVLKSEILTTV